MLLYAIATSWPLLQQHIPLILNFPAKFIDFVKSKLLITVRDLSLELEFDMNEANNNSANLSRLGWSKVLDLH